MKTILVIILVAALIAGAIWVATKYFGLFSDADKDGIPDKVEDTVDEIKARAQRVKEEFKDVVDSAKDVVAQSKDVVEAAKGGPRKGRKPGRKQQNNKPSFNSGGGGTASGGDRPYNTYK